MRSVGFSGEINIIKQFPGKPKGGQFQSLLFSLILQPVRINKPGAPLLGLAKSIYYIYIYTAILRKVVGKSARDNPVWVILSALFFKEI